MDQTSFQKKCEGTKGLVRKLLHFMCPAFIARVNPCLALLLAGLSFSALLSAQEAEAFKPADTDMPFISRFSLSLDLKI
jgi:hypothetical protein